MKKYQLFGFLVLVCLGCNNSSKNETQSTTRNTEVTQQNPLSEAQQLIKNIQHSHNVDAFKNHEAVQFNIKLQLGQKKQLDAKISMTTNSSKVVLETSKGVSIYYNQGQFHQFPSSANYKSARFDVLTWSYFFAMPFKLDDEGTKWQNLDDKLFQEEVYNSAKLSFEPQIGDAPDDWYVVYANPKTHLLKAAAYIVTFNQSTHEAEKKPHAIVYNNYFSLDKVPFASQWKFYNWSSENGIYGKPIGKASIRNLKFISANHSVFNIPEQTKLIN
ncbi:DUF6503 family protein [Psychroflexus sp. ALD_RP9]|uniref:DUF6503 family protein n=1 Tax=Psychroflexus sp. ALD_RP9 TaxID=2777186 RepID=UPI001A8DBA0F|nr:DUF6503 family protein [Psychroflexus sp. ALD_RP9]QSS97597.1 hypothetical protein IMZ30_02480 [Psychroflexus sp. ALD_RP9]